MAIIASSDFSGQGSNVTLTGKPLNNVLGGTLTPSWTGGSPMSINASAQVVGSGSYSGNLVNLPTAGTMRWRYTPTGNPDNFALYALATDIIFGGNSIGMLLVQRNSMRLFRTVNGTRNDLQSISIPLIDAPCFLELDQTVENTLTARVIELDGTTVRHSLTQPFIDLPNGWGWGLSMFGSGSDGTWDDVVFQERPVLSTPQLTLPTGASANSTTATGSVTTNVTTGTIYALDSAGSPDQATVLASGTPMNVAGAGAYTIITSGLTPQSTGIKRHYVHKRVTGETSPVIRSSTFNMPATLAVPGGSTATNVDGRWVIVTYTPTGTVSSATASLPAHATPNGAVAQAPKAMVFANDVWTAEFENVPLGDYAPPVVLASNVDHQSVSITGAVAFFIDDLVGEPEGPPVTESAPGVSSHPAAQSVVVGQTATFVASFSGGGIGAQWQRNPGGNTTWSNISGALSVSYTTPPTTITGGTANSGDEYRAVGTNTIGTVTTNPASLTVTPVQSPTVATHPANQTVVAGGSVTVSVVVNDGGGAVSYQWEQSTNGGTSWTNVGTNAPNYTSAALNVGQNGIRFRNVATNSAGSVTSNAAVITVTAGVVAPEITVQPLSQSILDGAVAVLNLEASSGGGTLTYQWEYSTNGGATWSNVNVNGTGNPFTTLPLTVSQSGIQYRGTVTNSAGSDVSDAATITVALPVSARIKGASPFTFFRWLRRSS